MVLIVGSFVLATIAIVGLVGYVIDAHDERESSGASADAPHETPSERSSRMTV